MLVVTFTLIQVSIAVKRLYNQGGSYKGKHLIGPGSHFRGSAHSYLCGKHDSVQAYMVLEEPRVLYLDPQAGGNFLLEASKRRVSSILCGT